MCPEVEKGHTESSWSSGSRLKMGMLATIRTWKRSRRLHFGDNFCQTSSPRGTLHVFRNIQRSQLMENAQEEQKKIVVFGAGGHVKVVLGIIEAEGKYEVLGILDDDMNKQGTRVYGYPVLGGREQLERLMLGGIAKVLVAIGDNERRAEIANFLEKNGWRLVDAIHPLATILRGARLGQGIIVMPHAHIGGDVFIGKGAIVSTGVNVGHDCEMGSWVHLGSGVKLAGNVRVGDFSFIGMGAVLLPGVEVGQRVIIGANAVVNDNIPDDVTAVGIPVRILER